MKHYQVPIEQLAQLYQADLQYGLTQEEAQRRLVLNGPNTLPEEPQESLVMVFLRQFKSPLLYVLLIAAVLITVLGNYSDALVIAGVLIFNAFVGTIQEGRAQAALARLKSLVTVSCLVMRDGKKIVMEDRNLVIGDVILVQEGDKIPADARIIESRDLVSNESLLTGESTGIAKIAELLEGELPIFEQKNMLFKGTTITSGSARALVVATGTTTEVGKLQASVEAIETDMPLKRELDRLSHWIVIAVTFMCVTLLLAGLVLGKPLTELLVILTALFIAVIPEGLPVVFTLVLVSGAHRMARKHVLVKRLQAVEGLGRADVIIIDKTGTLTRNELLVSKVYADGIWYDVSGVGYHAQGTVLHGTGSVIDANKHTLLFLMRDAAALLNTAELRELPGGIFQVKGEPTEAAMGVFAEKLGGHKSKLEETYRKLYEIPFNFDLRLHLGFYEKDNRLWVFVAGAPEKIMQSCKHVDSSDYKALGDALHEGLRVVGAAAFVADMPADRVNWEQYTQEQVLGKLRFLGFFGIQDAIRPDVYNAVSKARASGLHVVMATGDHEATARFIGKKTGILREGDEVLVGNDLEDLSKQEERVLDIDNVTVFARVTPTDKLDIVRLFKQHGHLVAMTGDGINDVPSLIAADLGIAMGISGTDVAKEAADLVLLDDSFSSIVQAIKEGRHIFYALRRVVWYFFSTNLSEVLVILTTFFLNWPVALLAPHILWLNLVTDGFLDMALSMEPHEQGLLNQAWLKRIQKVGLVDRSLILKIIGGALPMAIGSLWVFPRIYPYDLARARTMTLTCMAMFQWFNAWNCRSEKLSILQLGLFSNPWLIAATCLVALLQVAVIYIPFMQVIFRTVPIALGDWLLIAVVASSIIAIEEIRKAVQRSPFVI